MGILPVGRKARRISLLLSALFLCGAAALAAAHLRAWYHYRAGQSALDHYHFTEARNHLAISLHTWPNSWRVLLLAARAARLDGDFEQAHQYLQHCQHAQPSNPAVLLEWSLLRASVGELAAVEEYLRDQLNWRSYQTPLIQEALLMGYIRTYRIAQALATVEEWLEHQPEDTQALFLQGCIWQQSHRPQMALRSYRRAWELDPQRDDVRWRLAQCLVELNLADEAVSHLEYLHRRDPNKEEITVELAGARFKQGQVSEAQQLLDAVLAEHPDNEAALRERGRIALAAEDAAEAEKWLRQAARLGPNNPQILRLLSDALLHQGNQDEARALQDRLKQTDRDFQRLEQICQHELGERPNDPVLHSEFGALLLRLGYREAGRNWLLLALQEDPNCATARAALEGSNQNRAASVSERGRPAR
jgi:predicted Zn-dependent protease